MARDEKKRAAKQSTAGPAEPAEPNPIEAAVGAVGDAVGAVAGAVAGAVERAAETVAHVTGTSTGGHGPATAHGQPATVDTSLPATREELLVRHAEARRRRNAAPLGSEAFREAVDELGRIEVRVAAVERDQVPPRV